MADEDYVGGDAVREQCVFDAHVLGREFTRLCVERYGLSRSDISAERFANILKAIAKEARADSIKVLCSRRIRE